MKTHFACAVIWRWNDKQQGVEFLVIDSRSNDPRTGQWTEWQIKFPGGMNRIPGEAVTLTVQREILEETHLACLADRSKEIWKKETGEHAKHGLLLSFNDCRGEFRTELLKDNNDELAPPRWVSARMLGRNLFHGHQEVYLAACRELSIFG